MVESYTHGGNAFIAAGIGTLTAQTFIPRLTHRFEYLDLELFLTRPSWAPDPTINFTMPSGEPDRWPYLTKYSHTHEAIDKVGRTRFRYHFQPATLYANVSYAIVVHPPPHVYYPLHAWEYDKDEALYPRGMRYFSPDLGDTWLAYPGQDHIFAEFGDPPVVPSKKPPPVNNFALLNMIFTHYAVGLVIRFPTSVPCHLTCYWTPRPPRKHYMARMVRGFAELGGTYFCFVAWNTIEQIELGDTMYHTFYCPTWLPGRTRWFTFKGEVDIQDVPSIGPIFKHTHPGVDPPPAILRPNAPGDYQECSQYPHIGEHWDKVSEVTKDNDATYLQAPAIAYLPPRKEAHHITTPPEEIENITDVTVYAWFRRHAQYPGGTYPASVGIGLRLDGDSYYTNHNIYGYHWTLKSKSFPLNPSTGKQWLSSDLTDLQSFIQCDWYNKSLSEGGMIAGRCTQVYIQVTPGIKGGPD